MTLDTQGDELIKLYRSIEGRDVASFIIHRLHDIDGEGSCWNQTGVVDQNLNPKPRLQQAPVEPESEPRRGHRRLLIPPLVAMAAQSRWGPL